MHAQGRRGNGIVGEAGGHRGCDPACCVHCRAHAASLSRRQPQVPHCARPTPTRASLASHTECGASNRRSATPRRAHTTSSEPHMRCGSVHRAALESDCALRPTQLSLPPQRQPTAHAEGTFTSWLQRQSHGPMITSQQPKRPGTHACGNSTAPRTDLLTSAPSERPGPAAAAAQPTRRRSPALGHRAIAFVDSTETERTCASSGAISSAVGPPLVPPIGLAIASALAPLSLGGCSCSPPATASAAAGADEALHSTQRAQRWRSSRSGASRPEMLQRVSGVSAARAHTLPPLAARLGRLRRAPPHADGARLRARTKAMATFLQGTAPFECAGSAGSECSASLVSDP